MNEKYQLRYAAGEYWLLDMEQSGEHFIPPIILNRTGADIWQAWQRGNLEEQVIAMLCEKYALNREQAREDYEQFRYQAEEQGLL